MLDEPLGALDRAMREQLMNDLRAILKRLGLTAVYVTHDQEEAFAIADRVLIMRARPESGQGGWIEQDGIPDQVYRYPATSVCRAIPGVQESSRWHGDCGWRTEARRNGGAVSHTHSRNTARSPHRGRRAANHAPGRSRHRAGASRSSRCPSCRRHRDQHRARPALDASFRGSYYLIRTEHAHGITLTCEASVTDGDLPAAGQPLALCLDPAAVTLLPDQGE